MNCLEFEAQMESLLDGTLEPSKRTGCLEHAARCASCGELLTAVGGAFQYSEEISTPSLVEGVIERTIGSACGQAREQLPALVDQELPSADRQLIELHLSSCASCSQLATTLSMLRRELPRLAEVPLDDRFTHRVLAATLAPRVRFRRWWLSHWSAWVHRPRFAMEAAYVGLLLVMLVLGAFSTPVAALPQKGIELVQPEPGAASVWTRANDGLGTFWEGFASLLESEENNQESNEDTP